MKQNNPQNRMFPLFVDLQDRRILVIGGGRIAARRVRTLIEGRFGAEVQVVSPDLSEEMEALFAGGHSECSLLWLPSVYEEHCLSGADMVLACTSDPEVNRQICRDCRKHGILVNVASDQSLCDFHFPGVIVEDEVVIAFNGSGKNHKKVKELRKQVEIWLRGLREKETEEQETV